jgi:cytochrome c oxidase cbb3-type subunit 3
LNSFRCPHRVLAFVVLAALCRSANWAAFAQMANPGSRTSQSGDPRLAEAADTFASICAGCHGLDGRGAERGPNIASSQDVQRLSDAVLLGILQKGKPAAGMPGFAALGNAKLGALVSYLRTLQGKGAALPITGNPQHGGVLFFGTARCSECHMVSGRGGFIGSDLSAYATESSPEGIRRAIVHPDRASGRGRTQAQVTMLDGRVLDGVIRNEDNFSLQLQTLDGTFHFLQRAEVSVVKPSSRPFMPEDYGQTLSAAELDDIVGYLMRVARSAPVKPPKKKKYDED